MRELTELETRKIEALAADIPKRVRTFLTEMLQKCERPLAEDEVIACSTSCSVGRRELLSGAYFMWNPDTGEWE